MILYYVQLTIIYLKKYNYFIEVNRLTTTKNGTINMHGLKRVHAALHKLEVV